MTPPCRGQHDLFDSTDVEDHLKAREICAACPLIDSCREKLQALLADVRYYGNPEGTWAGELYIEGKNDAARRSARFARRQRIAAEDASFDEVECRRAHYAYTQGERSEWARTGHRVYQRRNKAKKVAA